MATDVLWESASALKQYVQCPAASVLPYKETIPMIAGTIRHSVMENWYKTGEWMDPSEHPRFKELDDDFKRDVLATMEIAKDKSHLFPPRDWVLSIEGSDLPPEYRLQAYGRQIFKVQVSPEVGLRGSSDLVCVDPKNPGVLIIPDWKGKSQEEHDIQAAVYAITHAIMFKGFSSYEFRAISLGRWTDDRYSFPAEEIASVTKYISALVKQKASDKIRFPRKNQWCYTCEIRQRCPLYETALSTADGKTVVPKPETFPSMDFSKLLSTKQEMVTVAKIAESLKDEVQQELLKRLEKGPVVAGAREYTARDKVSRWYLTEEEAAFAVAKKLGVDLDKILKLDVGSYREQCEAALKKKDELERVDLENEFKASLRSTTYKEVASKSVA